MTGAAHSGPAPLSPEAAEHRVRMRDGTRLATDVYLPDGGLPCPALLTRVPYDKCSLGTGLPLIARTVTAHGFALVAQDVRGKFRSEGEAFPYVHEAADGHDTLDWLAAQSFCDGTIGMIGDSYCAFTQWAAASTGHPALRAIAPRVTSGVGDTVGISHSPFGLAGPVEWLAANWTDADAYAGPLDWAVRPLRDVVRTSWDVRCPVLDEWIAPEAFDWAWPRLAEVVRPVDVRVPALHQGGWWDVLARGGMRLYRRMLAVPSAAPQHLLIDSVDHGMARLGAPGPHLADLIQTGDVAGVEAYWAAALVPGLDFLERHLRGRGSEDMPLVRWHQAYDAWRSAPCWPPPDARTLELHLAGDRLSQRPGRSERRCWIHDPAALVPDPTPDPSGYDQLRLPVPEGSLGSRDDVLTFTADSAREPLDLVGPVALRLAIASSAPSTQLVVKLLDLGPDGVAALLLENACIVRSPRYGAPLTIELGEIGYRLREGHRLRVELASSRFPRYLPHPGTDEDPWGATAGSASRQELRLGGESPAFLRLTIA